ncbi:hypothetical protein ANO11243_034360 [Dothideomycetidae sp. 11243]|nr:hypothetical protein ANO11243_034360 [fungal sp. No.11243]
MSEDPKAIVKQAYDHIADWYLSWIKDQLSPRERYAEKVLASAPPHPRILELGCGPGVPITRMLLDRGAHVVANDISARQVDLAKERCPEAEYRLGDMADLNFPSESFDGVTSFYTIFHLPRTQQRDMLARIHTWLQPGGLFVLNLATVDEDEIHGEMMGHGMFWSSFSVDDSLAMVKDVGFKIVESETLEAGDGQLSDDDPDYGVKFLWIAAQK